MGKEFPQHKAMLFLFLLFFFHEPKKIPFLILYRKCFPLFVVVAPWFKQQSENEIEKAVGLNHK